jgi:phosphoenolpyruvate synthase/pyruvate phosphate dikinase
VSIEKLQKSDINLKEWEYEFQQRDRHSILMADLWSRALFNNFQKEMNLDVPKLDALFTASSKGYNKIEQKKKVIDALRKACHDERYLTYMFETTMKKMKEQNTIAEKIANKINENSTNKELVEFWKEFDAQFLEVIPWYYIPYYAVEDNMISEKVKEKLEPYKEEIEKMSDFNNALMTLIFPVKEAVFQQEQRYFFELVKIAKRKEDHHNKAKEYLKKYAWMKTFITLPIEPLSMNELNGKITEAIEDNSLDEYKIQEKQKEKNRKLAEELIEVFKDDKELINSIEWARKYGWALTGSVEQSLIALHRLIPFFKLISQRMNVPYELWNGLTSKEVVDILEGKSTITKEELEERDKAHAFVSINGVQKMVVGDEGKEVSEWIENNIGSVDTNIKEFKGQPASPGIVKGKVKIAISGQDSHSLEKGEILVCAMTSPDYIPAMKKAAAIVTDEGGLLCHAAIISRELGKPCVIGTKIATKVLKNGMLVEVDANEGKIKILEENR